MKNHKTTLETKRLLLRPLTMDDFEAAHSWGSNPDNTRYVSFGPNTEEQTKDYLKATKAGRDFAIVLKETNTVIGSCGIVADEENYMAHVGWVLHKDYWKHGYGTEMCGALIRYGFEELKLGRIYASCAAVNRGSYRIMERNGMRREGLQRKAFWARVDKEWVDKAWYAILAEDYFAERSPLVGKAATATTTVTHANTARAVGSGSLDVFATPMMLAIMEKAACECLSGALTSGQTSVGTKIDVAHTAASPLGAEITATAVIDCVSGRKIEFSVAANDGKNEIGKGTHTRVIVDTEKFMAKVLVNK
ncbi:MAG: GNAT family N-acetyltransferase [Defluviitaleaceae bacterium]|nr:GNAT family N-acetyltransferase [Defluviitaleaceae bacterium]